jgi:predicted SAM-dependent methyltransferase
VEGRIAAYASTLEARRAATSHGRAQESVPARVKKRLVASPELRFRVRLLLTHAVARRSRRRADALLGTQPLRLNLGSYLDRKPGFVSLDLAGIPVDVAWDLVRPLPFPSASVEAICHDHTLEHLTLAHGLALSRECFRVLRPGGCIRISVPDAGLAIRDYGAARTGEAPTPLLEMQRLFYDWGHQTMYDGDTLSMLLAECGFAEVEVCAFRQSRIEPCPDIAWREGSLYMEAVKPGGP